MEGRRVLVAAHGLDLERVRRAGREARLCAEKRGAKSARREPREVFAEEDFARCLGSFPRSEAPAPDSRDYAAVSALKREVFPAAPQDGSASLAAARRKYGW